MVHCLDNRVAGKACQQSPLITFCSGITNYPRYLGIHFDRKLTYRQHTEATALKCKKGLLILKAVAKVTSSKTMMFTLDHPSMQARQRWNILSTVENPHNLLCESVKDTKGCRLGRGKSRMGQAEDSILQVYQLTELKQTKEWERGRYPNRFRP